VWVNTIATRAANQPPIFWPESWQPLPRFLERVSLGVENHLVQIKSFLRRKCQIKILERFGKEEAGHFIALFVRNYAFQRSVARICFAVMGEVAQKG